MATVKKPAIANPKSTVKVTVEALVAIEHDGERFEQGETFEINDAAATPLFAVNAIKLTGTPVDADSQPIA